MKAFFLFAAAAALLLLAPGCYYDNYSELHPSLSQNCDTNKVISYAQDIAPLLQNSCGTTNSCHSAVNTSSVDLSTYSGVFDVAQDGRLYSSVTWDGNASQMPQGSSVKISVCSITKLRKWIGNGAPNN